MLVRSPFKKAKTERHATTGETLEVTCPKLISRTEVTAVQSVVSSFLTTQDFINVSKASRGSHALFAPTRSINKLQNLLQAVVYGDLKEAKKIIHTDPSLLLKSGTVTDYSGRTHSNRTAFQLALGACDYNVNDAKGNIVVRGMVEMLEPFFKRLPGKTDEEIRKIMHDQYVGQFPEGHEALEAKRIAEDSAALYAIINLIADLKNQEDCTDVSNLDDVILMIRRREKSDDADKLNDLVQTMLKAASKDLFDDAFKAFRAYLPEHQLLRRQDVNVDLLKAIYQFRWYLEPKGHQTIGKHFNHQLLAEAADLYDKHFAKFGANWSSPKNSFYFQNVVGGIERHVPACDAQSIAHGLWDLFRKGRESPRSLHFSFDGGKYYPLTDLPSFDELGYSCSAGDHGGWAGSRGRLANNRGLFQFLCRAKTTAPDFIQELGDPLLPKRDARVK